MVDCSEDTLLSEELECLCSGLREYANDLIGNAPEMEYRRSGDLLYLEMCRGARGDALGVIETVCERGGEYHLKDTLLDMQVYYDFRDWLTLALDKCAHDDEVLRSYDHALLKLWLDGRRVDTYVPEFVTSTRAEAVLLDLCRQICACCARIVRTCLEECVLRAADDAFERGICSGYDDGAFQLLLAEIDQLSQGLDERVEEEYDAFDEEERVYMDWDRMPHLLDGHLLVWDVMNTYVPFGGVICDGE